MKSSRIRRAALAWGAILASGTVYAQAPYALNPGPYRAPARYAPAPYGYPQYQTPMTHLPPAVPVNLAEPTSYPRVAQITPPANSTRFTSDQDTSVLTTPVQSTQYSNSPLPLNNSAQYGPSTQSSYMPLYPTSASGPNGENGAVQQPLENEGKYDAGPATGTGPVGNGSLGMGPTNGLNGCGASYAACAPQAPRWYAGAYGLILARDLQDNYTFSFDSADESSQLTNARDADMGWEGGLAVAVGRYFNCGCNALEFVYWGWYPDNIAVNTFDTSVVGNLNGIHNWNSLDYNGANAATFVDNARVHSLFRQSEVHNLELNVLQLGNGGGVYAYTPWQYSLIAGVRYFQFDDRLVFRSDTTDAFFNGDVTELQYDIDLTNRLYGVQIGGVGSYAASPRFAFNGGTKFGLFGNHITHQSMIGGPAGLAVINNGPFAGREWLVRGSKDDLSFLGEVFLGGSYALTPRWSLSGGYRAVAVTGLALPTDQIYADLRGINDVESIESNSSVILHGAYFGAQYCF